MHNRRNRFIPYGNFPMLLQLANEIHDQNTIEKINEWKKYYRQYEKHNEVDVLDYLFFVKELWKGVVNADNYHTLYADIVPDLVKAIHYDSPFTDSIDNLALYSWDIFFPHEYSKYLYKYCFDVIQVLTDLKIPIKLNTFPGIVNDTNRYIVKLYPYNIGKSVRITVKQLSKLFKAYIDRELWNYDFAQTMITELKKLVPFQKIISNASLKYNLMFGLDPKSYKMWRVDIHYIYASCGRRGITPRHLANLRDSELDQDQQTYRQIISEQFFRLLINSTINADDVRELVLGIFDYGKRLEPSPIIILQTLIENGVFSNRIEEVYRVLVQDMFLILNHIKGVIRYTKDQDILIKMLYEKNLLDELDLLRISCLGYGTEELLSIVLSNSSTDIESLFDPITCRMCLCVSHQNFSLPKEMCDPGKTVFGPIDVMTDLKIEPTIRDIESICINSSLTTLSQTTIIIDDDTLELLNSMLDQYSSDPDEDYELSIIDIELPKNGLDQYTIDAYHKYESSTNRKKKRLYKKSIFDVNFILQYNPTISREYLYCFAIAKKLHIIAALFFFTDAYNYLLDYFDMDLLLKCKDSLQKNWVFNVMNDNSLIVNGFDSDYVYRYTGNRGRIHNDTCGPANRYKINSITNINLAFKPSIIEYLKPDNLDSHELMIGNKLERNVDQYESEYFDSDLDSDLDSDSISYSD